MRAPQLSRSFVDLTRPSVSASLPQRDPVPQLDLLEIDILAGIGVPIDLSNASKIARPAGMTIARAAILHGWLDPQVHANMVAALSGLPLVTTALVALDAPSKVPGLFSGQLADGEICNVLVADTVPLSRILSQAAIFRTHGTVVTTAAIANNAWVLTQSSSAMRNAVSGLRTLSPHLSAASPLSTRQVLALVLAGGFVLGGLVVAPAATLAALLALLTLPFVAVVCVRLVALREVLLPSRAETAPPLSDHALPTYTVLVPMYDEAAVLPQLVAALAAIDYPAAKLELILVLEAADTATQSALARTVVPPNLRSIIVPDRSPRTKPKALNYALTFASGDYVVVFDAEDRPEPDQLRKAAAAFASAKPGLACLQARLNVYNPTDSWLTRHFAIEYSALFDAVLPALDRLGLPLPLGGTSNHFPRLLLKRVGGWDPYNVTEDADLGIRLARLGLRTRILNSTTWEEAPITWAQWLPQRTRWLKGWYQTYAVHTRMRGRLRADLGLWRTLGLHAFLGGSILSTLVHPLFYALLAIAWWTEASLALPGDLGQSVVLLGSAVLATGYLSAMLVGWLSARRRGRRLATSVLSMPLLWLAVSIAGYRALWQVWRQPFLWEKTPHGRTRRRPPQFRRRRTSGNQDSRPDRNAR